MLARVLLAQDLADQALALLDRLHAAAATEDRAGSIIEAGALRALALAATGEEEAAVGALAGTLTLACPQAYVRVFADEGPPMAALLGRWSRPSEPAAGRRSRSAAWPGSSAPSAPGTPRRIRRAGHRRARHRRAADQPRARGAGDAGGGQVEPVHRR